jgi:hypothetical protein
MSVDRCRNWARDHRILHNNSSRSKVTPRHSIYKFSREEWHPHRDSEVDEPVIRSTHYPCSNRVRRNGFPPWDRYLVTSEKNICIWWKIKLQITPTGITQTDPSNPGTFPIKLQLMVKLPNRFGRTNGVNIHSKGIQAPFPATLKINFAPPDAQYFRLFHVGLINLINHYYHQF